MKQLKNKRGLTLIEIIVSLAILGIVAVGILSIFTSGMVWIYSAGDKGVAYSTAQEDVEGNLIRGDLVDIDESIEINFEYHDPLEVPGESYASESYQVGRKSSSLESFIPFVPSITLSPKAHVEGEISPTVTITGENTSFNGTTRVDIHNRNDAALGGEYEDVTIVSIDQDKQEIQIKFPNDPIPVNAKGGYIIRTTTNGNDIQRARYGISKPYYIAAGNQAVYASPDKDAWQLRSGADMPDFPGMGGIQINDGVYGNGRYVLVGNNGRILVSRNEQDWESKSESASGDINSVAFSSDEAYVAVTSEGKIIRSYDGSIWNNSNPYDETDIDADLGESTEYIFMGITGNPQVGSMITVGYYNDSDGEEKGVIFNSSNNGKNWSATNEFKDADGNDFIPLNGVDVSVEITLDGDGNIIDSETKTNYVAVGANESIYHSVDGQEWVRVHYNETSDREFRDVNIRGSQAVAVGDGITFTSNNYGQNNWTENSAMLLNDLHAVTYAGGDFIAAGVNGSGGIIINPTSSSGTPKAIGHPLYAITGRI